MTTKGYGEVSEIQEMKVPENAVVQAQETPSSLLEVIARAARDPSVDIDKLERLLEMQERVQARNARAAYIAAKIALIPSLPSIDQRGHIIIRDKDKPNIIKQDTPFARFEDIHEAVMPVLTAHGFDLSYRNGMAPDGKVRVTTILAHIDGHSEETYFDLPHDSSGSKNAVQAIGSSTSYGKRYGTISILNLRVSGEDDDGEKGGAPPTINDEQIANVYALIEEVKADRRRFLDYMKAKSVEDIPASRYGDAVHALEAKRGK